MTGRDWEDVNRMLSVDAALDRILEHCGPLPPVRVSLLDADGLVLAEDVLAEEDIPPFDNSAMDGYALRSADTVGASPAAPVVLHVVESIAAGAVFRDQLRAGQAARIMTGAAIPNGADAVVRFEETDEEDRSGPASSIHQIGIRREASIHENIRDRGEDIQTGDVALTRQALLRPGEVGLLAALNQPEVSVHRRPKIGILSTGDEVASPGEPLFPGQIRDSNSFALASAVRRAGGEPVLLGVAHDTAADFDRIFKNVTELDMIISSGGVSVGDYDVVKDVLRARGEVDIWQVRIKPGKPLAFGILDGVPLLGLPGNPAAAFVSFEQFGRPAIARMLGKADYRPIELQARLEEPIANKGRRRHFVRGVYRDTDAGLVVRSAGKHGSAMLSALVQSNCFIVIPEEWEYAPEGSIVRVQPFEQ